MVGKSRLRLGKSATPCKRSLFSKFNLIIIDIICNIICIYSIPGKSGKSGVLIYKLFAIFRLLGTFTSFTFDQERDKTVKVKRISTSLNITYFESHIFEGLFCRAIKNHSIPNLLELGYIRSCILCKSTKLTGVTGSSKHFEDFEGGIK